jgi:TRAP-type transport system small permease protein
MPAFLSAIDRVLGMLELLLEWLVAALLIALVAILALKLVDRHFIDIPISAPDEYAKTALVWITFIGFALAVRAGVNIRVDLIAPRLPVRLNFWLEILFDVLLAALSCVILVKGWAFVRIAMEKLILGTDMPEAVPDAALLASAVLIVAFVLRRLLARLRGETLAVSLEHEISAD